MPPTTTLVDADLLVRGAACGMLLIVAAVLIRDHRRLVAAQLGAFFAISGVAHAISISPGLCEQIGWWRLPVTALAVGGNVVFWLFTRALFDDEFRLRPLHVLIWAAIALLGFVQGWLILSGSPAVPYMAAFLTLETLGFVGLAATQIFAAWRGDLVEPRRRLRLYVVVGAAAYIFLWALANMTGVRDVAPGPAGFADALGLAAVASLVALSLLTIGAGDVLFGRAAQVAAAPSLDPEDRQLAQALERAMTVDRTYRQDGLTIADLAGRQGVSEHRLRRLINQALGYRNFNAFVNRYRIADARQALADPAQAAVPVLTIALDSGFASLGPFNRAFKAETGQTPTDFRRGALAEFEFGKV